ncbi:hypothetical protein [Micromonospora sp. 067-2]|uniref:hypothetical protein n=1 Tax=Micromonospora sp. 067-2 TaxID=2789270 RepID=UPI003978D149
MSESEQLRHAMRVTERPGVALDLVAVLRDGRRLRIRRRIAGAGAATLAAGLAVVVGVLVVGAGPDALPTVERPPSIAAAPTPPAVVSPTPPIEPSFPDSPPPTAERTTPPSPLGKVIDSGIRHGTDQRVFFLVPVSVPGQPRVTVGLAAGRRATDGTLTTDVLVNDVRGTDRSAGFHQIGYDEHGSAAPVPTFGYFVGPAKRITGTVDGEQVDARLTRWSVDQQVVVFWFDPAKLTPGDRLDGIIARDSRNRRL